MSQRMLQPGDVQMRDGPLKQFIVQGIDTSIPLHQEIFADEDFRAGNFDTKFMERFLARRQS